MPGNDLSSRWRGAARGEHGHGVRRRNKVKGNKKSGASTENPTPVGRQRQEQTIQEWQEMECETSAHPSCPSCTVYDVGAIASCSAKSCTGCLRLVLRNPLLRLGRGAGLNCCEKCAIPIERRRLHPATSTCDVNVRLSRGPGRNARLSPLIRHCD